MHKHGKEIVMAKKKQTEGTATNAAGNYVLKALMNVRKEPSLDAEILGTKTEGAVVNVLDISDDWLHLAEGAFILYEGGKFADKVSD